jgi:transposase
MRPINRQSERYAREGIDLSASTLADQVGACAMVLQPLHSLIETHVRAAERLHDDDTTVPIPAKGNTVTGRIWTYVRDDRPFGGATLRPRCIMPRRTGGMNIRSGIFETRGHSTGRRL